MAIPSPFGVLLKRRKRRLTALVQEAGFFDADWYVKHYPDVIGFPGGAFAHYIHHGIQENRSPGPKFDPVSYLKRSRLDPSRMQLSAMEHFLYIGQKLGEDVPDVSLADAERPEGDDNPTGNELVRFLHGVTRRLNLVEHRNLVFEPSNCLRYRSGDPLLVFSPVRSTGGGDYVLLSIDATPSRAGAVGKVYVDYGAGFAEDNAVYFKYDPVDPTVVILCEPDRIQKLRWDPDELSGTEFFNEYVFVRNLEVSNPEADELRLISGSDLTKSLPVTSRSRLLTEARTSRNRLLKQRAHCTTSSFTYICVYRLFLGRLPTNAEIGADERELSLWDATVDVVSSREFETQVLHPVLRGHGAWFDASPAMDVALVEWASNAYGVGFDGRPAEDRSVWRQNLAVLLADPVVRQALAGRQVSWAEDQALARALRRSPSRHPRQSLEDDLALVVAWGGFDEDWYRDRYGRDIFPGLSPIHDYLERGEAEGRRPNPLFDPAWVKERMGLPEGGSALVGYLRVCAAEVVDPSPLFDAGFYRSLYGAELGASEPLAFFRREGWRLGHDPNPAFDSRWYVAQNAPGTAGDPLSHYLLEGAAKGCEPSPLFRSAFVRHIGGSLVRGARGATTALELYLRLPRGDRQPNALFDTTGYFSRNHDLDPETIDAAWHFHRYGYREGRSPSHIFDINDYFQRNYDVKRADLNPLIHYLQYGAAEGRRAARLFDEDWYVRTAKSAGIKRENALEHYILVGHLEGRDPNPLFDSDWYWASNADVASARVNPLAHYVEIGWREHRKPNPLFDVAWYLETYPHIAKAGIEPLSHYLLYGSSEGYDPGPDFSTAWYLREHPESGRDGWLPLAHYLHVGRPQGYAPGPGRGDPLVRVDLTAEVSAPARIDAYASWLEVNPAGDVADADLLRRLELATADLPKISVVMPCYNTDPIFLAEAIDSVRAQLYQNWELCICDDASPLAHVGEMLDGYARIEPRLRKVRGDRNLGIGGATNAAAALASGDVIALLDHDDLLHPHALGELALAYDAPEIDIVYTDDDKIGAGGRRYHPQFKPGWSPTLLLSFMYMSHLFSFRRALFEAVGGVRSGFDGSQDFDLALRMSERARRVERVPRVLYHWRAVEGSTALGGDVKPEAFERGRQAVQDAFDRRGARAVALQPDYAKAANVGVFEPRFSDEGPSVTIVIPTRDKVDLLRACVESLRRTTYRNFDILIVDNESTDLAALAYMAECGARIVRVASPAEGFSFARLMNAGVAAATGEYVLLLNNDTEVRSPNWLSQMMGYALMPKVGAVGARLLYDDHRLQHGGITHGLHEGTAGHSFKLLPDYDLGYLQLARASREVAGVTAACMLTPKRVYEEIGGLDEVKFKVAYNDVDFCYRLTDAGYRCIQCGSAELYHHEGKTRGFIDNPAEITAMRRLYQDRKDAFYNPNLTLDHEQFEVARTHVAFPRRSPVKALFVSHNFNHEGAPNSLFELSSGLKAAGRVDPILVSPEDGPLKARYTAKAIPAYAMDSPLLSWPPAEEFEANIRRVAQTFLYSGVEVVVANTAESFWAVAAARRAGLPCIWIIRESEPWKTYFSVFPRHIADVAYAAFAQTYRIVFVARATLEAWKPLDSRNAFTLIRNGLDTAEMIRSFAGYSRFEARRRMEAPDDACVFTCVGTVAPRKGQLDLVRAVAALPEELAEKAFVLIIGDRPSAYSEQLHTEIGMLPKSRRDRLRVIDETGEARSYLTGSDVFICASRVESYPRVTLEAMAAGLPLITTGVWGIREQVRADYNARLYEPGAINELVGHMAEMIEYPETRQLFASRSVPVFESLPDFNYMRERYAELIEQAVGSL